MSDMPVLGSALPAKPTTRGMSCDRGVSDQ